MTKQLPSILVCDNCKDRNFCLMQWGYDCKRQGGKRIPRMKYKLENKMINGESTNRTDRFRKVYSETLFNNINTKTFNW